MAWIIHVTNELNWYPTTIKSTLKKNEIKIIFKNELVQKSVMGIWDTYFLPADTNFDGSVEFLELLVHMKAV